MPKTRHQVKVACLACRAHKTRCDGANPCESCRHNQRQCTYRPSRRGGARRGAKYEKTKSQQQAGQSSDDSVLQLSPRLVPSCDGATEPLSDSIVGLISPSSQANVAQQSYTAPANDSLLGVPYSISPPADQHRPNVSCGSPIPIRCYGSERDLLNAYYIFVHPYLPLLPPPPFLQSEDRPLEIYPQSGRPVLSTLPYRDRSPFALALSAILVLIPTPGDPNPLSESASLFRESYSNLYVQAADELLQYNFRPPESNLASLFSTSHMPSLGWSSLHPAVPSELESILAMLMLAVYEYCQMGNRRKMRARAHQALTAAMDLSLHRNTTEEDGLTDAHKRTWWMTMFLVTQSAIFNHSESIIMKSDPRISIPYPEFRGCREPWPLLMEAQDILLKAGSVSRDMVKFKNTRTNTSTHLSDDIRRLDFDIVCLGSRLDKSRCVVNQVGAETFAARNLWVLAIQLVHTVLISIVFDPSHSARIKLHRFIAFADKPLFLDKHCDLTTVSLDDLTAIPPPPSQGWMLNPESDFPFTAHDSARICLKSSLVIARILRNLPCPNPSFSDTAPIGDTVGPLNRASYPRSLPYLACCSMQSCYVLLMLVRLVRSCLYLGDISPCSFLLSSPEPGSEVQDAERLVEEMRHGVACVRASLTADSIFAGVSRMAREVEATYSAHFPEGLAV